MELQAFTFGVNRNIQFPVSSYGNSLFLLLNYQSEKFAFFRMSNLIFVRITLSFYYVITLFISTVYFLI